MSLMFLPQHANLTQATLQKSLVDESGQDNGVSARITNEIGTCTAVAKTTGRCCGSELRFDRETCQVKCKKSKAKSHGGPAWEAPFVGTVAKIIKVY
jgi:hypothetical protein